MIRLYRRDLDITPQDEMHLEVDHYLTPTDITEDDIVDVLKSSVELSLEPDYKGVYIDNLSGAAKAILSKLKGE